MELSCMTWANIHVPSTAIQTPDYTSAIRPLRSILGPLHGICARPRRQKHITHAMYKMPEWRHPVAVLKEAALCDEIPCGVCSN